MISIRPNVGSEFKSKKTTMAAGLLSCKRVCWLWAPPASATTAHLIHHSINSSVRIRSEDGAVPPSVAHQVYVGFGAGSVIR